jgi:hypothetical protein
MSMDCPAETIIPVIGIDLRFIVYLEFESSYKNVMVWVYDICISIVAYDVAYI